MELPKSLIKNELRCVLIHSLFENININDICHLSSYLTKELLFLIDITKQISGLEGGYKKVYMIELYEKKQKEFIELYKEYKYGHLEDL